MRRTASIYAGLLLLIVTASSVWLWWDQSAPTVAAASSTHSREERAAPSSSSTLARDTNVRAPLASEPATEVGVVHARELVAASVHASSIRCRVRDVVNGLGISNALVRYSRVSDDGVAGESRDSNDATNASAQESRRSHAATSTARAPESHEVRSDTSGICAPLSLDPGRWLLAVEADGFRPRSMERLVTDDPSSDVVLDLCPSDTVKVELETPDGKPLFDAEDELSDALQKFSTMLGLVETRELPPSKLAANQGSLRATQAGVVYSPGDHGIQRQIRLRAEPRRDRYFEFSSPLPAYLSVCLADVVLQTKLVQPNDELVVFEIPLESLRSQLHRVHVRVLDAANDQPLQDAKVALIDILAMTFDGSPVDGEGKVTFEDQPPGRWSLWIRASDYEWIHEAVRVASEGDTDLGTYRLSRGITIAGSISDDKGAPVQMPIALVPMEGLDRSKATPGDFLWGGFGPSDHFEIRPVARRKQVIRPSMSEPLDRSAASSSSPLGADGRSDGRGVGRSDGRANSRGDVRADARNGASDEQHVHWRFKPVCVDTTNGSQENVAIHCVPGTRVQFHVKPRAFNEARIVDEDGLPVAEQGLGDQPGFALYLAPGAYSARLTSGGETISATRFEIGEKTQDVELDRAK